MAAPFEDVHLNLSHFNLRSLSDEAVALCAPLLEHKDLVITNHIGWDIPDVNANYEGVRQLLFNLLGQAIQNTNKGTVELWAQPNGESLLVRIANHGVEREGRPLNLLVKALSVGGANCDGPEFGLGCTRKFVETIGGKLWVESLSNGLGSAITFSLPLVKEGEAPLPASVSQDSAVDECRGQLTVACIGPDKDLWKRLIPLMTELPAVEVSDRYTGRVDSQDLRIWVADLRYIDPAALLADLGQEMGCSRSFLFAIGSRGNDEEVALLQAGATDYWSIERSTDLFAARLHQLVQRAKRSEEWKSRWELKAKEQEACLREIELKEQELVRNRFKMASQEKMATLGTLTAGIAHEIKNPLNFVNNFAESSVEIVQDLREELFKRREGQSPDSMREINELMIDLERNATEINKHGKRANHIVESMLDLTRGGVGQMRHAHLNELVEEYSNYSHKGRKIKEGESKAVLQLDLDAKLPSVEIVPHDLGRVIINLVNNAMDAVSQKSRSLAESGGYKPFILVSTRDMGEMVEIRIRDNGPGVPEEVIKNMFAPFFTTKPTGDGNVGLGLAICHNIITKIHHGVLTVDTLPNDFTEFTIRLPKRQANPAEKAAEGQGS